MDLGAAWRTLTGLPFVYAAWAGRPGGLGAPHLAALGGARDRGLAAVDGHRPQPAAARAGSGPAPSVPTCVIICGIRFGDAERAGLERFLALAAEVRHSPPARPLRFY